MEGVSIDEIAKLCEITEEKVKEILEQDKGFAFTAEPLSYPININYL